MSLSFHHSYFHTLKPVPLYVNFLFWTTLNDMHILHKLRSQFQERKKRLRHGTIQVKIIELTMLCGNVHFPEVMTISCWHSIDCCFCTIICFRQCFLKITRASNRTSKPVSTGIELPNYFRAGSPLQSTHEAPEQNYILGFRLEHTFASTNRIPFTTIMWKALRVNKADECMFNVRNFKTKSRISYSSQEYNCQCKQVHKSKLSKVCLSPFLCKMTPLFSQFYWSIVFFKLTLNLNTIMLLLSRFKWIKTIAIISGLHVGTRLLVLDTQLMSLCA